MPGTIQEQKTFANWQMERIAKKEDPTDGVAFIEHVRRTGGDTTRLSDYGFPMTVTITPAFFPKV